MIRKDQCTQVRINHAHNKKHGHAADRSHDQEKEKSFKTTQCHSPIKAKDIQTISTEASPQAEVMTNKIAIQENVGDMVKPSKDAEQKKILTSLFWSKNAQPYFNCPNAERSSKANPKTESVDVTRYQILLFGGIDPFNSTTSDQQGKAVLQYNIKTNNWKAYTNMPGSRHHHSAIFYSGKIFIIGGTRPAFESILPTISKSVWSFDPHSLNWRNERDLPYSRRDFGLVGTRSGIFVIGGEDNKRTFLASTIVLRPETAEDWVEVEKLQMARTGLAAALVDDNILAAGGILAEPQGCVTDAVESYNLTTGNWTQITNLRKPRSFAKFCVLAGPKVYIVGGVTIQGNRFLSLSSVDKLYTKTNEWQKLSNMSFARHGHDVLALDDKILIFGGVSTNKNVSLNTVECYSTTHSRWITGVRNLPLPLSGTAAVIFVGQ